jgi:GNAT superfamily N-acetyltransferase
LIQPYTDKYREPVREMIIDFYKESMTNSGLKLEDISIDRTIDTCKDNTLLAVNGKCFGLLGGYEVPSPVGEDKIFQEMFWYIQPEYKGLGVKIYKLAEKELKRRGFNVLIMGCLINKYTHKFIKFYERIGYKPLEMHFIKRLGGENES